MEEKIGKMEKGRNSLRKKRLIKNTVASLMYQVMTIICGFILPRYMLSYYGSEVNGLVSSITQFLQLIAFLDLGVGSVVQSSLYKPLADGDTYQISCVLKSASRFFKRLARILLVYVIVLIIIYPVITNQNFGFLYTATLIVAMCISFFAQYYFGVVNRLMLLADQKGYVQYNIQIVTLILNTLACVILITNGASIQLVKLVTSLIYLFRPIGYKLYVDRHYKINRNVSYKDEPIKQKWNGVAQHVAAVILDGTDTIVLTLFSTLSNVSIYSVYHSVVNGVKQLFVSMTNGIQSLMGELWAKKEIDKLHEFFGWVEWVIHTGVVFIFGCTMALILPFVRVYTRGISDTNYIQPLFAILIVAANAGHCLRIPYNLMILAGGHYKQTQSNYIIAAILNLGLSIILVNRFGLVGVAIGTLVAMLYQTVWMAYYDSKNLICWPFKKFIKQCIVDIISLGIILVGSSFMNLYTNNYVEWILCAIKVVLFAGIIILAINGIFYRDKLKLLFMKLINMVKRK